MTPQSEFLQGLVKLNDKQSGNISASTWINYRTENNIDDPFVSGVTGQSFRST